MNKENFLQQVFNYIDENISECIAIDKISEYMHYSIYHFSRTFTELTGMSPMRYITLRKLQYAIFNLSNSEKVVDVALKYGFDTPEGFSKAFKNFYGYSPAKYPFYDKLNHLQKIDMTVFNNFFGGSIMTSQPVQKGALKSLLTVAELLENNIKVLVSGVTVNNEVFSEVHKLEKANKINVLGGTHYSTEKFACQKM